MTDSDLRVALLEPGDVAPTATVLAAAMEDDPAYEFIFPRLAGRRHGLEDLFRRHLRTHLPYRCTHVATVDRRVVATVTLRPPDGFSISLLTMVRRGLLPFGVAHGLSAVKRLFAVKATYDALEARLARGAWHWLVHMMAVDPALQGRGIGTRLLERVLAATVDATRDAPPPAILTTHKRRNVVFYERAGFEVDRVEDVSLMGAPPYPAWSMRRRART